MSQDQGNQWNRSESSLDLVFPEFEPWADSLWTDFPVILVWKVHPLWTSFRKANLFHSSITLRVLVRVSWRVWTEHPHTSHFLKSVCTHFSVARDIGSMCHAHVIHVSSCVWLRVWSDTLRLSTLCFPPSLSSSFSFSCSSPSTSMWVGSMRSTPCTSANEELGTISQRPRNLHPGVLRRRQALKSACRRVRWLHHRHGAFFTTVSGARRSSEP